MPYKHPIPDAPIAPSMLPRVPAANLTIHDILVLTQPGNNPGEKNKGLELGTLFEAMRFSLPKDTLVVDESDENPSRYLINKFKGNSAASYLDEGDVGFRVVSIRGARTNTWLTNATYGLEKLLSDPALDAYAIVLSINDRNNGGAEWLGTIDDIHVGDPSLNADSFYGCYAKIIENILSHAPNAKIFCVQHAYNKTGLPKDYNDAISAIASLYNLPCVPEFEDSFFSSEIYTQMYGGHPTYVGYAGMADALCRLMRKAMVDYKDYFKQYVPIL